MNKSVHGIHHVTAIGGHPQANVDFYVGVLGGGTFRADGPWCRSSRCLANGKR